MRTLAAPKDESRTIRFVPTHCFGVHTVTLVRREAGERYSRFLAELMIAQPAILDDQQPSWPLRVQFFGTPANLLTIDAIKQFVRQTSWLQLSAVYEGKEA